MTRYLLLMCGDETAPQLAPHPAADGEPEEPCWMPWAREMEARGILLVEGAQLQPTSTATSVRNSGGEMLVADGPFAETKEQIAGLFIVECQDLDEAIEVATAVPAAWYGTVEVRPVRPA